MQWKILLFILRPFSTPAAINFTWRADICLAPCLCLPAQQKTLLRTRARDLHIRGARIIDPPREIHGEFYHVMSRNKTAYKGTWKTTSEFEDKRESSTRREKLLTSSKDIFKAFVCRVFLFFLLRALSVVGAPALWRISFYFYDACIMKHRPFERTISGWKRNMPKIIRTVNGVASEGMIININPKVVPFI